MRSKYETNVLPYLDYIEAWARDGVAEKDIAKKLNIDYSTLRVYKEKYEALSTILARTKEYVDLVEMVGAYKKRAEGYDYPETTFRYKYEMGEDGKMHEVLVGKEVNMKHVPGDPRAMENWLRFRQRDTWGTIDGQAEEIESGGVIEIPMIEEMDEDE